MAIDGLEEIHMTVKFKVPPGASAAAMIQKLSEGGVSVALGLLQYAKSTDIKVVDATASGPNLGITGN